MYERCITFEGPEHFCKTSGVQETIITDEIKSIANEISSQVMSISYDMYKINRMILYFKRDKNKNIYFLFATSARTYDMKVRKIREYDEEFTVFFYFYHKLEKK